MLGRPRESARLAQSGLEAMRRYGIESVLLVSNRIEALLAIGDWDDAEALSAGALRRITSSFPHWLLILRAGVETGRGDFDAARAHLEAASATLLEDRVLGLYDAQLVDLALWERRWADAGEAVRDGLARARSRGPCCVSSSCSPSGRGSIRRRRTWAVRKRGRASKSSSG